MFWMVVQKLLSLYAGHEVHLLSSPGDRHLRFAAIRVAASPASSVRQRARSS